MLLHCHCALCTDPLPLLPSRRQRRLSWLRSAAALQPSLTCDLLAMCSKRLPSSCRCGWAMGQGESVLYVICAHFNSFCLLPLDRLCGARHRALAADGAGCRGCSGRSPALWQRHWPRHPHPRWCWGPAAHRRAANRPADSCAAVACVCSSTGKPSSHGIRPYSPVCARAAASWARIRWGGWRTGWRCGEGRRRRSPVALSPRGGQARLGRKPPRI